MTKATKTQQSRLILSPKVLQKSLVQSATRAQKMADAFSLEVPAIKTKATKKTRTAN
jgi:hypothetical protein